MKYISYTKTKDPEHLCGLLEFGKGSFSLRTEVVQAKAEKESDVCLFMK